MTSIPDELLMAYADGELEPSQRAEVEAAMAADPHIARRVEHHRSVRRQLASAFDRVMVETVPDRLVKAASSGPREATVTDLRRVRAARAAEAREAAAQVRRIETARRPWTWVEWGAIAVSLIVGAVAAFVALDPTRERIRARDGVLVAQADLAQTLTNNLASTQPPGSPVQIGLSFRSREGVYCRTFLIRAPNSIGGLACREGDRWQIQALAETEPAPGQQPDYRPASSAMPRAVIAAVEQQIAGEPLDTSGETAARGQGWK